MPHVTVTIPAYNHGRFVGRAIESVLAQSHPDVDVVVVDDASSDDTLAQARRYESEPRLRCFANETNLGLARNWNRCLSLARGPLVMVFGADDQLDADYLARASALFDAHPEAGFVYAPVRSIDASGKVLDPGKDRAERCFEPGDPAVSALIRTGVGTVTTVFRREACAEVGDYDEQIADGPDIELCARIAQRFPVVDAGAVGGAFRVHDRKWGHLSYLRPERLESYMRGNRLVYERLSPQGLAALGVRDLDRFLAADGARFALDGALTAIAYGQPDVARSYVRRAAALDPSAWRRRRLWQTLALVAVPALGSRVMRRRMALDG